MKYRYILSSVVASLALAAGVATAADPPPTSFRNATQIEGETPVGSSGTGLAPAALEYEARCSAEVFRTAEIDLAWSPAAAAEGRQQRVDISKFRDGFEKGRFETSGLLAASRENARLLAPEPGVNYYWRVLRDTGEGWVSSPVERFEVPICPWDKPSDPTAGASEREGGRR